MQAFQIEGGVPLSGRVKVSGNKNEALPALACALLTAEPITLDNVPDILDVRVMLDVMREFGVKVRTAAELRERMKHREIGG